MAERIKYLKESPCYKCSESLRCIERIKRNPCLIEISDYVMPRKDFDYHDCSLYKVLHGEQKRLHAKRRKHS